MFSVSLNKTFPPSRLCSTGFNVSQRRQKKSRVGTCHRIDKKEAIKWFQQKVSTSLLLKGARCTSLVRAFAHGAMGCRIHGVDPLSYFSFQPVLHDWCNKGCGMCYPVCGMVHIKEPLLLIGNGSLCGGSGFPLVI